MQNFLNEHLTPRNEKVVMITFIVVLEIVFMAFFASLNKYWQTYNLSYNQYGAGWALQLVHAIFFFIAYLVLGLLQFFNGFQQLTWVLIGNTCLMGLGLLLGLVGMGITSQLFTDVSSDYINYPVAFWFVQLMVLVVALMFEYKLYQNLPQAKVQPVQILSLQTPSQPPISFVAQSNPPYQPPNQQAIYQPMPPGQQQNSYPQ